MTYPHLPVLSAEVLSLFDGLHLSVFVDGTLGAGGHASLILDAHPEIEVFVGIDQDPAALAMAKERLGKYGKKVHCCPGNFRDMPSCLQQCGVSQVDGVLLDLGVSSMQLDQPARGMSFSKEGPLDMRMNPNGELTAELILNTWPEEKLAEIFRDYGEEQRWRAAARTVVSARQNKPLKTTLELVEVLRPVLYRKTGKQINPMTLIFQALRIAVNDELGAIASVLPECIDFLSPGGRLAVISFHSLEDRIVKNAFRKASGYKGGRDKEEASMAYEEAPVVKIVIKKPLEATSQEESENPRSRSAKLRAVEKLSSTTPS
jgi:16S rRNA (cytosine1402-N4)-methyltransferase